MTAQIVSFKCVLKDKLGTLISTSISRDVLTSLPGELGLLDGLAKALQELTSGEKRSITLSAAEAYGFYDPRKVILYPLEKILNPAYLKVGKEVSIIGDSGEKRTYKVIQIYSDAISLDGNHPLAGQDLIFEIETLEARAATAEEVFSAQNLIATQLLH